ncbi:lipoyl(octanoyl) transferase LipB [Roseofilum capinflatum]|uniref:Octanoyltransferase n=1 Tax=Roseofilum capinflatum BLCC-M114 TaxID=3022440 RepID=A0ABT7BA38_9CYAN|nr:lipoyl(octanoyl) transferase LipB [Roseofilum capinflatum]MDJ1176035.1 lipoyl(octanoyl) transferase LipB [Roseofilum capinflatum BLCC-M114]
MGGWGDKEKQRSPIATRCCQVWQRGVVPYQTAWQWQQEWVAQRRENPDLEDLLLLLEHPPVYTLGRGATLDFLKFDPQHPPAQLHRVERGGEVTYHCPGQLVGYPILNLNYYQRDLHWYLRQLETVLIETLRGYGLKADRLPGLTGVWLNGYKVGAIGIKVSRWITMHGFSLNVNPDLEGFKAIVPCGIGDRPVGSLQQFLPDISLADIRQTLPEIFAQVFQVSLVMR